MRFNVKQTAIFTIHSFQMRAWSDFFWMGRMCALRVQHT